MNAQEIFDAWFNAPRDPRSPAYKQGVLAGLRKRTGEDASVGSACPYPMGTAAADAWYAGVDEARALYRRAMELLP